MINEVMNIFIGFDINNDVSQISYYNKKEKMPLTITTVAGTTKYQIPTVLCKRYNTDKWYYGAEAVYFAKRKEGAFVDNLLELLEKGASVTLDGKTYTAGDLLSIYIELVFTLLSPSNQPDNIGGIMFTTSKMSPSFLVTIPEAAGRIGIRRDRIFVQEHLESFYYYVLNQKKELWTYDVALFEYVGNEIISYVLHLNRKLLPVIGKITEVSRITLDEREINRYAFKDRNQKKDERFLALIEETLANRAVSAAFLIGSGFDKSWAEQSIVLLCNRRRVFQGENLYTKGACLAVKERFEDKVLKNYLYESNAMIRMNIGMQMNVKGNSTYYPFVQAGINWYEAQHDCELILDNRKEIVLKLHAIDKQEEREEVIQLPDLPHRPNMATRLHVDVRFLSRDEFCITVEDMGFGELYPTSHKTWKELVEI